MIRRIAAVAQITVLESLSKKHLYILLLLIVGVYFYFGRMNFFNLGVEASFLKLIPLIGLSAFGLVISIFASARQITLEREQKTIFPLLAKPLTRFEFLAGKFAGVMSMTLFAVGLLSAVFYFLLSSRGVAFSRIYWQAVLLLLLQLCVFVSLVLALSTVMSHVATVVMGFLLYYLLGTAGATLEDMLFAHAFPAGFEWFYKGILILMPRLDLFNISKAVIHDQKPQSWIIVLPFIGYSAFCSLVFLGIGGLLFRRKDL
jgi:ABC-type transport system involved in multi-copper enzyme maturation permease subunit